MTRKVTEVRAHLLCCLVTLYLCLVMPTNSQKTAPPCSFILQNKKTMLEKLAYDFDKESSTVILEYAISFSSKGDAEDFINRTSYDTFEPLRWYRTQGSHSSDLLLSYELYFGYLRFILDLNVKHVDIELMVKPPGCFKDVEKGKVETILEDYLLQDFNIEASSVKHSFQLSEEVEICSTKLDVQKAWSALRYRCCGYDQIDHVYCNDVSATNWMTALAYFIIALTTILTLYFPAMIPKAHRKHTYDFKPANGGEIQFKMKVMKTEQKKTMTTIKLEAGDYTMKEFRQKIEQKLSEGTDNPQSSNGPTTNECQTFDVCVKKARFRISTKKLFTLHKTTFSLFRDALDFYLQNENHQDCCKNETCSNLCSKVKKFMKILLILFVLAIPSYPLAEIVCMNDLWFRKVVSAHTQRGYSVNLIVPWDISTAMGRILTGAVYGCCLIHAICCTFYDNTTVYTRLADFKRRKDLIAQSLRKIRNKCFPLGQCNCSVSCWKYFCKAILIFFMMLLLPVGFILYLTFTTPLFLVIINLFCYYCDYYVCCGQKRNSKESNCKCNCKSKLIKYLLAFLYWLSALFVAFVLMCGANFVVNAAALLIITVIVKGSDTYGIIPVIVLLVVYIRDCFHKVKTPYNNFMKTVLMTDTCKNLYFNSKDTI